MTKTQLKYKHLFTNEECSVVFIDFFPKLYRFRQLYERETPIRAQTIYLKLERLQKYKVLYLQS